MYHTKDKYKVMNTHSIHNIHVVLFQYDVINGYSIKKNDIG